MRAAEALLAERRPHWTRTSFIKVAETGVFDRVELVRGELVEMSPQGPPHSKVIELLNEILMPALVGRARVRVQLPLALDDDTQVLPDLAIVDRSATREDHPSSAILVIEVADSSKRYDTIVKGPLYAEARVREYWIVDVEKRVVELYSAPRGGVFTKHSKSSKGELVIPRFDDVRVVLNTLFG
ncbi:MAG: Uma2 family endonuclease [Archangium sp.]